MGLFRKSPPKPAPTELDALQSQLDALQRRIEITEVDQTHLGNRVVALDDLAADLAGGRTATGWDGQAAEGGASANGAAVGSASIGGTAAAHGDGGNRLDESTRPFDPPVGISDQLDELGRQLAEMQQRTVELQQHADERHAALRAEVDELRSTSPVELESRLTALDERLSTSDATTADTATRLAALDARLTNVSTELANQIGELGSDIDALAGLPSGGQDADADGLGGDRIDALATGQTKLASEQARYEIAFREDLATLAEQIRRSSGR